MTGSDAERALMTQLIWAKVPVPTTEYRFLSDRKFRFDMAWIPQKLAVEVDGGTWTGGRHTTGAGFARDVEKLNLAQLAGWRVFRVTPGMVDDGSALTLIERALGSPDHG